MKMNVKVFNSLTGEPKAIQDINGETLKIYSMADTQYHQQFISRGRMSAWLSDGKTFKLLVEEGFFDASGRFFDAHVNGIWIGLLKKAGQINSKLIKTVMLPAILILLLVVTAGFIWFPDYAQTIMIVAIIGLFVVQMVQSRQVNKKFEALQAEAQNQIFEYLGEEEVKDIVSKQELYMKEYYKIEDEVENTDTIDANFEEQSEEVEQIENSEEE